MKTITASLLRQSIRDDVELALIDVRDEGDFIAEHLFYARNVPLSQLRIRIEALVPRRGAPIVLVGSEGDGDRLVQRAAELLQQLGFVDVSVLEGGNQAAFRAGFEPYSGVHVPSKALGEFIELTYDTPHLSAGELQGWFEQGKKVVVIDARPPDEFHRMSIPSGINVPGADLVYRIADVVEDPETPIVVNCAGRTRSIIGAQSLINAGIANPVFALKDGTAGWQLAGLPLDHGRAYRPPTRSEVAAGRAREAAGRVAERFGVREIDWAGLGDWQSEKASRTLYLLDVRSREEFDRGHIAGFRSAPGGQLVQATDDVVGVLASRIVLVDDDGVRATLTASWLTQLGWRDVVVLKDGLEEAARQGQLVRPSRGRDEAGPIRTLSPPALDSLLKSSMAVGVVDLGGEPAYCAGHIPGSISTSPRGVRSFLGDFMNLDVLVIAADDDVLAREVADELAPSTTSSVLRILEGGAPAWRAAGLPTVSIAPGLLRPSDGRNATTPEQKAAIEDNLRKYLTWEIGLVDQVNREGDARFRYFKSADSDRPVSGAPAPAPR